MRFISTSTFWPAIAGILFGIAAWLWLNPATTTKQTTAIYSFADAVDRAKQSVASINTTQVVLKSTPGVYGNQVRETIQSSLGSAVIVDSNGYLLTNHHVIKQADEIIVTLFDGRSTRARVVGTDEESDLAVLWIDINNLNPIKFGSPANLRVGDIVLAIGNPFGFGHTVTQGIISATGRWGLDPGKYENYLQTDADINVGNSGGALIDANGELVGINSAIYSRNGGSTGIGLAIPVDLAERIMAQLIESGTVVRGWLGLSVQELNVAALRQMGLNISDGVLVTNVAPGGPAQEGGIRAGDIITAIDEHVLRNGRDGMLQVSMIAPGQKIAVKLLRDGQTVELTIVVGRKPTT